jgi:hypothetical protein
MKSVCVIQTDNRPSLKWVVLTREANIKICDFLGYEYSFIEMKNNTHLHPATNKLHVVNTFLQNSENTVLVFLDSDAWIQNASWLKDLIEKLLKNDTKQGCFSRDPYIKGNTFINSGGFILKVNEYTKNMYTKILTELETNPQHTNSWPYDQFYINNYILEHKEDFMIFTPDILNTPIGKIVRHNWHKTENMYIDLHTILNENVSCSSIPFEPEKHYDKLPFPNKAEKGYSYL